MREERKAERKCLHDRNYYLNVLCSRIKDSARIWAKETLYYRTSPNAYSVVFEYQPPQLPWSVVFW